MANYMKSLTSDPQAGRNRRTEFQHILLAEDNADLLRMEFETLVHAGYRVYIAEDGEAAWTALNALNRQSDGYDLLITDNDMPKLSGIQLLQKLRAEHIDLPVIMTSGMLPAGVERLQLAAILQKPFSRQELVKTVEGVFHAIQVGD